MSQHECRQERTIQHLEKRLRAVETADVRDQQKIQSIEKKLDEIKGAIEESVKRPTWTVAIIITVLCSLVVGLIVDGF